jgi:hypothetical protein
MNQDEPEWTEPVTGNIPLKIEVTGWTLNGLLEAVVDGARAQAGKMIQDALETTVREAIEQKIAEVVDARVMPIVDEVLNKGWSVTDQYGRATGTKGIKDLVIDRLAARNGYDNGSFMDTRIKETMQKIVDKAMEAEIATAKTKLRAEFDALLQSKVSTALREALGLRS